MDKLKVVFLFMSNGPAPTGSVKSWNSRIKCGENYTNRITGLYTEGLFFLLAEMKRLGIIDELTVFFESNRNPGYADWGYGIRGYVVPEIRFVDRFLRKGDVIFARGGFRTWHDWLVSKKEKGHWLLHYSANTGRQKWTFWDIIFWDLEKVHQMDRHERMWLYYLKPTHPELFYPILQEPEYDLCIGSSYIHDKKGQWRTINALIDFKKLFGYNLKAILPGAQRHGVRSDQIEGKIVKYGLDVKMTSMLPRNEMVYKVYNKSKMLVHLGSSGQNDRGPLEALACGLPLVIGSPDYHSPVLFEDKEVTWVPKDKDSYSGIAKDLKHLCSKWTMDWKKYVIDYYNKKCGFYDVIIPKMRPIFEFIRENRIPSKEVKRKLLRSLRK